jgi:hypothetical protein
MVGALVIAPGIASASPSTAGNTVLVVDGTTCIATVSLSWVAQPGRLKTFTTELSSDANATPVAVGSGSLGRSGSLVFDPISLATYGFSNQIRAITHVYDGKGVEQETWASRDVPASCS